MGTPLGPKYVPYTYMDPLGMARKTLVLKCIEVETVSGDVKLLQPLKSGPVMVT